MLLILLQNGKSKINTPVYWLYGKDFFIASRMVSYGSVLGLYKEPMNALGVLDIQIVLTLPCHG